MFCDSCSKLSYLQTQKVCIRCSGQVLNTISVLCDLCSGTSKQCAVCLKKVISAAQRAVARGCGCGGRK